MSKSNFKRLLKPNKIITYLLMTALVAFTALPLVYLVVTAFKPIEELFLFPPRFFVQNPTLSNFSELLSAMDSSVVPFTRYFANSVFVSMATVFLAVSVSSLAAYSMTKMKLPFADVIFTVIITTLMFSPAVTQISSFVIVNQLHMVNTTAALIIPRIAGAYSFFLLKQNMSQIPDALLESAKIDGCSYFGIYAKIVMPLSTPALATVAVFAFIANWNDFHSPLIYINRQALKTLPLALQMLQGGAGQVARTGAMAAATFVFTIPTILVFLFMQSKVIKTMVHSGIK